MKKEAVVVHSGGMDSSICLALALKEFSPKNVLSLSFSYQQRHTSELLQAEKICRQWGVDHTVVTINCLHEMTENALTNREIPIQHLPKKLPNTLVVGRNGLMARLGAIHADHLGAKYLYMGVIEVEEWNSGYRDCSRKYMDLKQEILRIDLGVPEFEIRTPLVKMTKKETLELAWQLGILEYLLEETVTCYEGIPRSGCLQCPACVLRNEGIKEFSAAHPDVLFTESCPMTETFL